MAFFDKLNELTATVRDKTSDVIEMQKLNAKINSEKSVIADQMKQIGEYYYNKHASGEPTDPEIADLLGNIDARSKAIQEVEAQLKSIKAEGDKAVFCGSCGARNNAGTNFCGSCGVKLTS